MIRNMQFCFARLFCQNFCYTAFIFYNLYRILIVDSLYRQAFLKNGNQVVVADAAL